MVVNDRKFGEILVEKGILSKAVVERALAQQVGGDRRLGEILVEGGHLDEAGVRWILAEQLDLPLVHPDPAALDPDALARVPPWLCRRYGVLPLYLSAEQEGADPVLVVAVADPARRDVVDDIRSRVKGPVRVVAALREEIDEALDRRFGPADVEDVSVEGEGLGDDALARVASDPTGQSLLHDLLVPLADPAVPGIHLRCEESGTRVTRLDGGELFRGGSGWHPILLDRLRRLAGLGAETDGVVDRGRFRMVLAEGTSPSLFRVSILRGVGGEEAQIRRLPTEGPPRSLGELGFTAHQVFEIRSALERPCLVWVTAPVEQGLGSTLFGLLREIPGEGRTVTVEDEVFYRSPDLLQIETLNLSERGRRELVRELRQLEFDRVVLDRAGKNQLADLLGLAVRKRWVLAGGAAAHMAETLLALGARAADLPLYGLGLLVHQRLVPVLCPSCRSDCMLGTAEREALAGVIDPGARIYQAGDGCGTCGGRGTAGARAFFEVLRVDGAVRDALCRASWGEDHLDPLLAGIEPNVRTRVAAAVADGEIGLGELWELLEPKT